MILHWIMALGIVALVVMGLVMTHVKLQPLQLFQLYQLHKSIGITILLAAVLRFVWRLTHRAPALPEDMPPLERKAAAAGHLLLYVLMFALPITGWMLVSVSVFNIPILLYGLIRWPHLPVLSTLQNKAPVEAVLKLVHAYGAYALIALVVIHTIAALRHHFVARDDVMLRMLPLRRKPAAPEN